MFCTRLQLVAVIAFVAALGFPAARAKDIRVTFPGRSELTPVQRLNREGVDAIRRHRYEKAEALFYKAYLYDAADPFTLNNLGYVSELEGKLGRAQNFYKLASEQDSGATISLSSSKKLEGKPMTYALNSLKYVPMRVNRMNVQAIQLLAQGRNFEADLMLQQALVLEPRNPFTLNNLGVAEEATGDFEDALKDYDAAADLHSKEPIVVTLTHSWRGKPVSEMAADSAKKLRKRMRNVNDQDARAIMLTFRGVAAVNQNNWAAAKQDFLDAYRLNPYSAFALNNLGYVAEKDGDIETAQFYYSKARTAAGSNLPIGLASDSSAEGKRLMAVAATSHSNVDSELEQYAQAARRQSGPVQLIRRNNQPAAPSATPNKPTAPAVPKTGSTAPDGH